ncbi:MAG: hypothetical protein ACKVU4_12150 [Phycisphaerales bacterium]
MVLSHPNPAFNSLFIVEPFAGSAAMNLFASHPPMERRIAKLLGR